MIAGTFGRPGATSRSLESQGCGYFDLSGVSVSFFSIEEIDGDVGVAWAWTSKPIDFSSSRPAAGIGDVGVDDPVLAGDGRVVYRKRETRGEC
jgi:hypothetical protein